MGRIVAVTQNPPDRIVIELPTVQFDLISLVALCDLYAIRTCPSRQCRILSQQTIVTSKRFDAVFDPLNHVIDTIELFELLANDFVLEADRSWAFCSTLSSVTAVR